MNRLRNTLYLVKPMLVLSPVEYWYFSECQILNCYANLIFTTMHLIPMNL